MQRIEIKPMPPARPTLSACPECRARLVVLKIIPGRGGCEYWTMRCTRCGGIHLNIVEPMGAPAA